MASNESASLAELVKAHRLAGSKAFKEKDFARAIYHYNEALRLKPGDLHLLLNRCSTLIKMNNLVYAAIDAARATELYPSNLKAKYYQTLTVIGVRNYPSAVIYLNLSIRGTVPDQRNKALYDRMVAIRDRLIDQLNGIYDMEYFIRTANVGTSTFPLCAEYVGPITIADIPGKGRGYVAVETIKPGQLIMVSKALIMSDYSYVFGDSSRSDLIETSVEYLVVNPLQANALLKAEFFELYAGPDCMPVEYNTGGEPSIQTEYLPELLALRLLQICKYNMFSIVSGDLKKPGFGLWLKPSYFNHSCINTNTIDIVIKDFMFVRATCEIKPDEEVLISYVLPSVLYNRRKSYLAIKGFECICNLCQYEKLESPRVHVLREEIMNIADSFPSDTRFTPAQQKYLIQMMIFFGRNGRDFEWNFPLMLIERKFSRHFEITTMYHLCFWILKKHIICTFGISNRFCYESFLKMVFMLPKSDCLAQIEEFTPMYTRYMNLFFGTDNIHWELLKNILV